MSAWTEAHAWESEWWGREPSDRWAAEVEKQRSYARYMEMPPNMDFGAARIVDFGCGPVSMLLRSTHGPSVGVDPLPMSQDRLDLYSLANVAIIQSKAEDADLVGFDEAWCYNCLQHTEDPRRILRNMARAARTVRLFEWIWTSVGEGHPQTITPEMVLAVFGDQAVYRLHRATIGLAAEALLHGWYIAIHAERIT